jgi:hypothetical protein
VKKKEEEKVSFSVDFNNLNEYLCDSLVKSIRKRYFYAQRGSSKNKKEEENTDI